MKTYLGDGVYADLECGMIKLTTEDGIEATNTIYLERSTYVSLSKYVEELDKKFAEQNATAAAALNDPTPAP